MQIRLKFIAFKKLGLLTLGWDKCFLKVKYMAIFIMASYALKKILFPKNVIFGGG